MNVEECGELPVFVDDVNGQLISKWKLSWLERLQVLWRGYVWMGVMGSKHPPIWVSSEKTPFNYEKPTGGI